MNNVNLTQTDSIGYTPRQTSAAYNNAMAKAYMAADPRFTSKAFDRPGLSRGAGTYSSAAAQGALNFSDRAAMAAQIPLADVYNNAMFDLNERGRLMNFGQALAGLQQDAMQADWANRFQNWQGALSSLYR